MLALGISLPLVTVGLVGLWGLWERDERRISDSLEQRAALASVLLERWVDAQVEPLSMIAASIHEAEDSTRRPAFEEVIRFTSQRLYWIDLRILDSQGRTELAQPANTAALPAGLTDEVFVEIRRRRTWVVMTDDSETRAQGQPKFAVGTPLVSDRAVLARINGEAVRELFRNVELSEGAVMAVFDPRGRLLYRRAHALGDVNPDAKSSTLLAALQNRRSAVVEEVSPYDGVRRVYGLARAGDTECVVLIGIPSATLFGPARRQISIYLFLGLLALAGAVGTALFVTHGITSPLGRLSSAAQKFGAGDMSTRAPVSGIGEVAEVSAAFNQMAEQIEEREHRLTELDRLKSEFVSSVSHELRTPLTTIKTLTRVMLWDRVGAEERRKYLEIIEAECDREIDLVLNLLDLSLVEAGSYKITLTRVDVAEVARACLASEGQAAEERGQQLVLDLPAGLPVARADYEGLRRALCNLVDNAVKYTPGAGRITIMVQVEADDLAIRVADTGRGIAPEELPHVFEKYYRGRTDATPSPEAGADAPPGHYGVPGTGLGLYLACRVVKLMGGRIDAESEVGRGSTFTIRLPAWRDEDGGSEPEGEGERNGQEAARGGR